MTKRKSAAEWANSWADRSPTSREWLRDFFQAAMDQAHLEGGRGCGSGRRHRSARVIVLATVVLCVSNIWLLSARNEWKEKALACPTPFRGKLVDQGLIPPCATRAFTARESHLHCECYEPLYSNYKVPSCDGLSVEQTEAPL